jgi:hypothetical protein
MKPIDNKSNVVEFAFTTMGARRVTNAQTFTGFPTIICSNKKKTNQTFKSKEGIFLLLIVIVGQPV